MICLGVSPFDAHAWVMTKAVLRETVIGLHGMGQHGGGTAAETYWISVVPSAVPEWMQPHGGSLRLAVERLRTLAPV
jgi:hypothetical protein